MRDCLWRNGGDMPDIIGNITRKQRVDVEGFFRAPSGRARLPKNQDIFGHDIWVIVTEIWLLNKTAGALHTARDFVPNDVLVKFPATLHHALRDMHGNGEMFAFMQNRSHNDGTKTALDGDAQNTPEHGVDVLHIVVQ